MRIDLFDYDLPPELIAQEPAARRDASRLLVLDRAGSGDPDVRRFRELPTLLRPGDLLVVNDAMVDPLRLHARRASGGVVEVLLLRPAHSSPREGAGGEVWEAMVRGAKRLRDGEVLRFDDPDVGITIREALPDGRRSIELPSGVVAAELLDRFGEMPLPPYIRRRPHDRHDGLDRDRYQTVYARAHGAVAAPTAGLHFTRELMAEIEAAGMGIATLTLRVGPGTFQPVRVEEVEEHRMEAERYELSEECVGAIVATKERGGRVVGVGTTVVRTLEHAARAAGRIEDAAGSGDADIFIFPGFELRVVDAMLTNFHLPRSTPILMASALAGRERLLDAYRFAVQERFRFYSYGDAMLIR